MIPLGFAIAALLAETESRPRLDRVPQLQAIARMAGGGALGCGWGTLNLVTSRGVVTAGIDLNPIHVFGNAVRTADLILLLESRATSNRTGKPGPMSGQVSNLCYVCLSALARSKEPAAIPVLAELLTDPDDTVRRWSVIALFELGESDEGLRADICRIKFPQAALDSAVSHVRQAPMWLGLNR